MGSSSVSPAEDVITLEPTNDPVTGQLVYAPPAHGELVRMTEAGLVSEQAAPEPVALPRDRFAGDEPYDWQAAEQRQDSGYVVSMEDGQLVVNGATGQSVELPKDRFAAPTVAEESVAVRSLSAAGAGRSVVSLLKHTSQVQGWPATMPTGWIMTTRPTRHGDQLTVVIAHDASTGYYHAHLWRFDLRRADGSVGAVDVPAHLNKRRDLTAHHVHIYPAAQGGGILCLSTRTRGGMPTLTDAVLQCAKWADGVGDVLRGKPFPYRQ